MAVSGEAPARDAFLPFARPVLEEAEIAAVVEALRSGWLTTGPRTARFQEAFAAYVGRPHAVALSSCTAALFLALKLEGIGEGDEVVVPPLTFAATANVVVHAGATPVFADVDPVTGLLDPGTFAAAVTPRTKAVIPVHLHGNAVDPGVAVAARARGIRVIADCAHAVETTRNGVHVAAEADLTAFSFYATKNLAVGEGGMLVCAEPTQADRAAVLALHGMSRGAYGRYAEGGSVMYEVVEAGWKYNMTDIAASLGLEQLKRLEARHAVRARIAAAYSAAFADLPVTLPAPPADGVRHAWHIYALRARDAAHRARILEGLARCRIGTAIHFQALHLHPYYRERYGHGPGSYPAAEAFAETTFSIPLTPYLADADVADVIRAVRWAATR